MNEQERQLCSKQLSQILTLQIEQISSYLDYLSEIKAAITNNQISELNVLLDQTINPEEIENTQLQQSTLLNKYSFEMNEQGLSAFIEKCCNNNEQLLTLKSVLTDNLKKLDNALLINSILVQKNQHRIKQSIRLLSGHALDNKMSSYSRQGSIENNQSSKNILAEA